MSKKIFLIITLSLSAPVFVSDKKSDNYYEARFANMSDRAAEKSSGLSLSEQFAREELDRQDDYLQKSQKADQISAESKTQDCHKDHKSVKNTYKK